MITNDDISRIFHAMLGRAPESDAVFDHFRELAGPTDLVRVISESMEFRRRVAKSPFEFYNTRINAEAIVRAHENPDRAARAGFKVNYFGVAI